MPSAEPKKTRETLGELQRRLWATPYNDLDTTWRAASAEHGDGDLCLVDRYFLLREILHRPDAKHEWVFDRCREVEKDPDGYIDIWARGHFKSSIITFAGVIQEILRDSDITVGIFSHSKHIAKAFLAQIKREFEANNDLRGWFPHIFHAKPQEQSPCWSLDNGLIVKRRGNPKEATIEAHGLVDGQPTSRHFGLMVFDDVVVEESVNTEDQIQKTTEAWSLSDNLGSQHARKWIIGTRYHYADTYQTIIEKGAAKLRKYPATKDGTLDGEPVFLTPKQWTDKKTQQLEATVACQLLCDPQAGNQRMFDPQDLPWYEVRPQTLTCYLLCDPAHSMKKDSDDTAMVVIGIDRAGNKYLLDGVAHHMELVDKWKWLRDLWDKWRNETGVQSITVGYERYGAISDISYFKDRMKTEGVSFDIEELSWPRSGGGSKKDRVQRLGPDFQNHRFHIPYPTRSDGRLTSAQQRRVNEGYGHLISRRIVRRDHNNKVYDLTQRFLMQVGDFPYCMKKDIIDAVSRIFDLDIRVPIFYDPTDLEPDAV